MVILSASAGRFKAFGVEDGKLVHGVLPVLGRPSPISGDIAQGQPDQLGGGLVSREMAAGLDDLAQPGLISSNASLLMSLGYRFLIPQFTTRRGL